MTDYNLIIRLFGVFLRIGAFTFGGGYAMLPLIERDVVDRNQWLNKEEFIDLFAVSQSLPGVFAVNMSIFIGYRLAKFRGAVAAALGAILPSFCIILALAIGFDHFQDNPWVVKFMLGLRPAVVALIAAPVITTWRSMKGRLDQLWIPILAVIAVWFYGVSAVTVIVLAGLLGIFHGLVIRKYLQKRKLQR